eukprot:s1722_g11.t1
MVTASAKHWIQMIKGLGAKSLGAWHAWNHEGRLAETQGPLEKVEWYTPKGLNFLVWLKDPLCGSEISPHSGPHWSTAAEPSERDTMGTCLCCDKTDPGEAFVTPDQFADKLATSNVSKPSEKKGREQLWRRMG